jgi:hypothetical protein
MSDITAVHYDFKTDDDGLTSGMTVTRHFTRQRMKDTYVAKCKADPMYVDVYVGDDCVIAEVRVNK